jgi:hypothetical protein
MKKIFIPKKYLKVYIFFTAGMFVVFMFEIIKNDYRWFSIILAFVFAALVGIWYISTMNRILNRILKNYDKVELDLLPDEKILHRSNASLKRLIMLGGILFLTSRRICFIYAEFKRSKLILELDMENISEIILKNTKKILLKTHDGKIHTVIVEDNKKFYDEFILLKNKRQK